MNIYLVWGRYCVQYEGCEEWFVCAYFSEKDAEKHVEYANKWVSEHIDSRVKDFPNPYDSYCTEYFWRSETEYHYSPILIKNYFKPMLELDIECI
jgi:hypothetical protein